MKTIANIAIISTLLALAGNVYAIDCPRQPKGENENIERHINAEAGRLAGLKIGQITIESKKISNEILSKYPGADKLYMKQMMYSVYCSAIRDSLGISEIDKIKLLREYEFGTNKDNSNTKKLNGSNESKKYDQNNTVAVSNSSNVTINQSNGVSKETVDYIVTESKSKISRLENQVNLYKEGSEAFRNTFSLIDRTVQTADDASKIINSLSNQTRITRWVSEHQEKFSLSELKSLIALHYYGELNNPLFFEELNKRIEQSDYIYLVFEKYKDDAQKRIIVATIIQALRIDDKRKTAYLNALDKLDSDGLNGLHKKLNEFISEIEMANIAKSLFDAAKYSLLLREATSENEKIKLLKTLDADPKKKEIMRFVLSAQPINPPDAAR